MSDLRVGQVCTIFRAPDQYSKIAPHPLAYIEWFTPLHIRDEDLGMFSVARSTRQQWLYATIIPITQIARTCHLLPNFGKSKNPSRTSQNILDRCERFFVNPYLRHSDFVILRLLVDEWLKLQTRTHR